MENMQKAGKLDGVNMLVGDQNDPPDLQRWVKTSGGSFDVIIDDGAHHNTFIHTSFVELWGSVKPGS